MMMEEERSELLQGTLELIILSTLSLEPLHGYGISRRIEQISQGVFKVNAGSLFPALYRLEEDGMIAGSWKETENKRRAKYYRLTPAGKRKLESERENWIKVSSAMTLILGTS